jgi:hypothetical protein
MRYESFILHPPMALYFQVLRSEKSGRLNTFASQESSDFISLNFSTKLPKLLDAFFQFLQILSIAAVVSENCSVTTIIVQTDKHFSPI